MEIKFYLTEPIHLVLQGEGKHLGQKMILIRTHLCDIQCENCDTAYSWKKSHISKDKFKISVKKLVEKIIDLAHKYEIYKILITGGEPQLQQKAIYSLIATLPNYFTYEIETTGKKSWLNLKDFWDKIHFNFSPKIAALKSNKIKNNQYLAFKSLPDNFSVKIVVSKEDFKKEIIEIQKFQKDYNIANDKVFLMPLGKKRNEIVDKSSFIITKCFELKYNFSPRLHILIYDNKKLV